MDKSKEKTTSKKMKAVALRDSKDKSVLVEVVSTKIHPLYKKRYSVSRKYLVHTEKEIKASDLVIVAEARPISKKKSWQVIEAKKVENKE